MQLLSRVVDAFKSLGSSLLKRRREEEEEPSDDSFEPSAAPAVPDEPAEPSEVAPAAAGPATRLRRQTKRPSLPYDTELAQAVLPCYGSQARAAGQARADARLQRALEAREDVRTLVFGFDAGGTQIGTGARSIVLIPSCEETTEVFELSQCHLVRELQQSGWVGRVEELLRGTRYWRHTRVSDPQTRPHICTPEHLHARTRPPAYSQHTASAQ